MASDFSLFNTVLIWIYWGVLFSIPLFVMLGVAQLLFAIVQWRSERRTGRLKRAGVFFVLAALMPVALLGLWRGVMRPSMASELTAKGHKRIAEASVLQIGGQVNDFQSKISELIEEVEHSKESAGEVVQLNVGDRFPSIKSVTLDGKQVTVGPEFYGKKATLVVFWSTWCKFCMIDLPHEVELANHYESSGLRVLGVNADDDLETAKRAVLDQSIPWLNLYEGKEKSISNQLAITSWPALLLLDGDGTIIATTDMLRRTSLATMPDGSVQSAYKLDTYIKNLLEANER